MRKLRTLLLVLVMLCLVCGTLAACNPNGGNTTDPDTPDEIPPSNSVSIASTAAYAAFREAALNTYPGNYFNFGLTLGLDYVKDESGRYYSVKFQAAIDPADDDNSQLLVELLRTSADGNISEVMLGFYYYDGTVVYDCTKIKKGASVVKTDDLDLTAIAKAVDTALGGTSIGSLIIDNLLGIELGQLGTIEGLLGIFMGKNSRMVTAADGTVEYQIPINIASLLSVVGGLLEPGGLLGSYSELVNQIGDILGLDLAMLPALVDTSAIYMIASVRKGDDGINRLVGGPSFQIGLDFNTAGTSLEDSVGIIESELDINLGIDEISVGKDAPILNVRDYLVSVRELDIDNLDEYSPLTLELGLELNLDLRKNSFEIQTILASLGSLLGNVSIPDALKTLNIDIQEDTSLTLALDISAEINMRDPAQTNLLVTITGQDGKVRGTVAYVGSEKALFADLSGILGRDAKIKVSDFNLNEFLSEQIDGLLITIRDAIAGLSGSAQQSAQAEYDAAVTEPIANGDYVKYYVASSSGDEPANLDTVGLIQAILGAIEVDMDGDIFNIEGIGVTLTKQIINSILGLAGVNGTLPLMGDIRLQYTNPGFGETKTIDITGLALGIDDGSGGLKTLADVGLGLSVRVGTVGDAESYENTLAAIRAANANNEYANLLTFSQLLDIANVSVADILANVGTVSVDLSLGIDINAIGGDFLQFGYDSNDIVLNLLAAFAEEGIDGNAVLKLAADVNLASLIVADPATGGIKFNAAGLLDSNLYLALLTGPDAVPSLELWLNGGVVYLSTELLGGMNIKVDLAPFLADAGSTATAGSVVSDALTAAGGDESISLDINVILALLAGIGVGNTYIDVYLAAFTLTQLFETLGLDLGGVSIKLIGEGDEDATITGGVKIELGDGLNLGQAGIDVYLGIGKNADINISLGGFGAGIGANANAVIPEDKANACVNVLENPFVYLYMEAGLEAFIAAQGIPLGEELGNIVVGEDIEVGYSFEIEGYLDLRPIVAKLFGGEISYVGNQTRLAIQLSKNKGTAEEEVLIGVYYKDGRAYLDLSALGIAAASVELDLMELLVGVAMKDVEPLAGGQAYTADGEVQDGTENVKTAIDFALKIGSKGFTVTLVQGLTQLLAQYIAGITNMEIDALLAVDWSGAEGSKIVDLNLGLTDETGKSLATIELYFEQIALALAKRLGNGENEVQTKVIPDDETLAAMASIGSVIASNYTAIEAVGDAQAYAGDLFYYETGAYLPFTMSQAVALYYEAGNTLYVAKTGEDGTVIYEQATLEQAQAAEKAFKDANGSEEFTLAEGIGLYYGKGGKLYSCAIGFNLTLPAVHFELKAEIEMGTSLDSGVTEWSIGQWISSFLNGTDIDEDLKSFVSQLLVQFQLVDEATVKIGIDLAANLRFNPEKIDDIPYVLSHSDLALVITGTDNSGVTEELLALYVIANEATGRSNLYLSTKENSPINGLKVMVPDLDLAALVSSIGTSGNSDTAQGQALSSADAVSSADGDGSSGTDILSVLEGLLANCIYSIVINNSGATLSLGSSLVAYVLSLIPGTGVPAPSDPAFDEFADSFVQLNPAKSYLSLFVGDNAGGLGGKFALEVGLGVDPVYFSLGLGGLNIDFSGDSVFGDGSQTEEEYFRDYKNFYEIDALSVELTVGLDLTLKDTLDNEGGTLDIGSMLDALIGEALVAFGLEIPEDLKLGAELYVGANLSLVNADDTQIVLELRDKNDAGNVVFGVYLDGPTLWIRGGVLPIGNVRIENTGYAQLIADTVTGLLSGVSNLDTAEGSGDALTAAEPVAAANEAYEIFFELANERIALSLTETFIVALISAVAGEGAQTATDIAGIIEKLNLGANVDVVVDFSTFTIDIGLSSNLIDLGVSIVEPSVSLEKNADVESVINGLPADEFNSYPETSTKVSASVDITLGLDLTEGEVSLSDLIDVALGLDSVQAGINGYSELITANDAIAAKNEGKKLYKFVDGKATEFIGNDSAIRTYYNESGKSLYQEGGIAAGTGRDILTALLNSLGLELILTEKITTDIGIHIDALLDLTALGDYKAVTAEEAKRLLADGKVFEKMTDGSYVAFEGNEEAVDSVYAEGGTLYTFGELVASIFSGDFESIFTYSAVSKADAVAAGSAYVLKDGKYVALAAAEGQTFEEAVNAYEGQLFSRGLSINLDKLLAAVEAHVRLSLNDTTVDIYFAEGMLYVDLTAFGGSKIAIDVMWLIDALSTSAGSSAGEALTADGAAAAPAASSTTDVLLGLINAIIKRVSLQTAIAGTDGNLLKGGLGIKALLGSEVLSLVFSQLIGEEVTVEDLLFGEDANLTLKLQPQDNGNKLLELGLHAPTASGVTVDLGLGAGLSVEFATPTDTLISETERGNYSDVTGIVKNILAIVNGTATDPEGSQNVMFSVMGRVYFDVNGDAVYDLGDTANSLIGSLLSVYIENLVLNLSIDESASTGLGFRLTAGLDVAELAAIDFEACKTNGALDFTKFLKAFLTEVPSLRIALELLELDENLDFARYDSTDAAAGYVEEGDYVVKGGIYIENGSLYLDGTSIFGVAENYSFVPNFTKFVADLIEVPAGDDSAAGSALSASVDAYASADSAAQRDALVQVLASSKTLKVVITKAVLSVLLVTLMPDLGDITDVFDKLDVSLGLDAAEADEIFINLGIDLGKGDSTQTIGLELGGIVLRFGEDADRNVVPAYINAQKSADGKENVPLVPFYDSVIRLSTSVELELGITEGKLDFGGFLKDILGDLSGVVIDMPATAKGYSSANIRLDLAVMLDMFNPAQSEIYIELYNLSNEAGAEVKWLGVYYSGMTLYLDLDFLGLPKIAVPLTLISDYIDEYLGFLLDSDIYNTVVINGSTSAEGLTAEGGSDGIEDASLTLQEKAVSLLISERKAVLSVGNYMLRYVLSLFDIGGKTLEDLVYENLEGGLDLSVNYDELLNLEIGAYLDLEGDRFVPVEVTADNVDAINAAIADAEGGTEYYGEFVRYTEADKDNLGDYIYTLADAEEGIYRLLGTSETNENNRGNTEFAYVEPADRFRSDKLTAPVSVGDTVYQRVKGDELNLGAYDMHLALDLGIKNFELSFITEREPLLTGDELESYMDFNTAETVTVSETISLDLLFDKDAADISLVDLLNYLFEGNSEALEAFITAVGDSGGDLNREISIVVALEFRLGAFLNYLRSLNAQYDLRYGSAHDQLLSLGENVDLITFINAITAVIGAKAEPNADGSLYYEDNNVDDLVGLEDLLEFINASVRIVTNGKDADGNDDGTMHDILGVYFVGGEFVEAPANSTEQKYSNFFRSETGAYGYVNGEFKLISEIEKDGNVYGGDRYGYDASYMYPNDLGGYVRKDAGLYVDLSYLGQPSVYMALSELQNFIGGLMSDSNAASEALTADDNSGAVASNGDEVAPPSVSIGSFADKLPLLSSEIASYIKAFLYGIRMTSSFIQVLVEMDYLNNLLGMLTGENDLLADMDNQSYLTIYTDVNNYNYTYASEATEEQVRFADSRFNINIDDSNGLYYVDYADSRLKLRSTMSAAEAEEYQAQVDAGTAHYYSITPIVTYIDVEGEYVLFSAATAADKRKAVRYTSSDIGKNGVTEAMVGTYKFYTRESDGFGGYVFSELNYTVDALQFNGSEVFFVYALEEKNPFIEVGLYLWDYKATLSINLPETAALDYSYVSATAEQVKEGIGLYEENAVYVYETAGNVVASDAAYIYFRGAYHPVVGNLYVKGAGQYELADDQNNYTIDGSYYVACTDNNVVYYVALTEDRYYERVQYDTVYTEVDETAEGGRYFVREQRDTTNIHNPDMFVDFSVAYKVGEDGVQLTNSAISGVTGINPTSFYQYDESSDAWNRVTASVADHANNIYRGEEILHLWYDAQGEFVSYSEYKSLVGGTPSGVFNFYIAEPIKYVDSSELYTVSLTLRGSLSLSGLENYISLEDYAKVSGGKEPEPYNRYNKNESGEYVQADNGEFVKVSGNVMALRDILGGIVGDLSSLLIVGDGYEAEILFELKAQVSLEYGDYGVPGNEDASPDTMWISEIDLAIDTWLRLQYDNGDEYLRHFIGIYYDTDPETGSTALYLDLTWLLGSGAKFKVDMSAYSLEDLIQGSGGILGIFGQGGTSAEAMTAAGGEATGADEVVLTDTDVASVILGIYTRRIVLQASAGLVRLVVGLIAPDAVETISKVLPNVVAEVEIGMAPYNLNIGLGLYDESGDYGILGIGLTLNLFDASDRNNGTRLDLGPTEDFLATDAALLAANSPEFIFYQAMYTALLNGETAPAGSTTYVSSPDATKQYVAKSEYDDFENSGAIEYVRNDKVSYNLVEEVYYSYLRGDYNSRYALVPTSFSTVSGSLFVKDGETYVVYTGDISAVSEEELYVPVAGGKYETIAGKYYFYTYDYATGTPAMVPYTKAAYDAYIAKVNANTSKANAAASTYTLTLDSGVIGARLYSYNGNLEELAACIADKNNYTKAVKDTFGAHKSESVFGGFNDLLALDLNAIMNGGEGAGFGIGDIAGMLNVEDMELTLSIDLNMQFSEIVNWTRQLTELLAVDGEEKDFFKFLLQSATLQQTEFLSYIGGTLVLTAYVKGDSIKAALSGMDEMDTMTMIKTMLAGAEVCIEVYYDSNYNGEPLAEPLTVWVTFGDLYVTDEDTGELVENPNMGAASVYIDGAKFAEFIGLVHTDGDPGSYVGNFFSNIKIADIDIFSLFAGDTAGGSAEGMTAVGGTVNDGEATDTGLIPSNIWSYIGMALGYVMITDNTIGIGLAETLVANAVELLAAKFTGVEFLPKLTVSYDVESSGVAIIFGDTPSIDINLGLQSGGEYYATKAEIVELLKTDTQAVQNYGIVADGSANDNFDAIVGAPRLVADGNGGYRFAGEGETATHYLVSGDDYAVAAYACSEYVWLGKRYTLNENNEFVEVTDPYSAEGLFKQADDGAYVRLDDTDLALDAFKDRYESAGKYVTYKNGDYVALKTYLRVTGKTEGEISKTKRYNLDVTLIEGEYLELGDLKISLSLGNLGIKLNQGAPSNPAPVDGGYTDFAKEGGVRISTSVDVSYYGAEGEQVDLSSLVDFIVGLIGVQGVSNNDLRLNITSELGYDDNAYFNVKLDIYADIAKLLGMLFAEDGTVADTSNMLQLALSVRKYMPVEGGGYELGDNVLIGVYLVNDTLYVDLSALLGETAKVSISGLNIIDLIMGALGGTTEEPATDSAEGLTAGIKDVLNATSHDYAYLGALVNPGYFSVQLTMAVVEAILGKVAENMPDKNIPTSLIDIGDIIIEAYGDRADGDMLSIGVKFSEGFAGQLAIKYLYLGTEELSSYDGTVPSDLNTTGAYLNVFDIGTGELGSELTIGASAQVAVSMTSTGLSRDDVNNYSALASAAEAKVYSNKLYTKSGSSYTEWEFWNAEDRDARIDSHYAGGNVLYSNKYDTSLAGWAVDLIVGLLGPSLESTLGTVTSDMINVQFAADDLNLAINLTADLNIAAIMKYGLTGILFSDIKLDIQLVDFTRSLLKVYYLGSSRLTKTNNYYKLSANGTIFSDAIYVDASGLGFGLIKLSGLTGLIGGTTGGIYDEATTASSALTAAEGDETATNNDGLDISGLSLTINLANDNVGIKLEESIIDFVFGMIEGDIANYIPDIKSLNLELAFGETGIQSISLDSELDGAGTGLQLSISNVNLALGGLISDTELTNLVNEVQEGYGGLAMSNTSGIMTMLQNIIDTAGVNLNLNIDKRGGYYATNGYNSVGWRNEAGNIVLYSRPAYATMDASGWLGNVKWNGQRRLMLNLNVASSHDGSRSIDVWFGNNDQWKQNNIYITGLRSLLDEGALGPLLTWVAEKLGIIDLAGLLGSSLIPPLAGNNADVGTWTPPEGATAALSAADAGTASAETAGDATTSSVTADTTGGKYGGNKGSYHAYSGPAITDVLNGLIDKVDLNLFTSTGYMPYMSGASLADGSGYDGNGTRYISIKITFDKVAFNELLIFLYTMILGLLQGKDADGNGLVDSGSGVDWGGPSDKDAWYFVKGTSIPDDYLGRHTSADGNHNNRMYIISNLFRELEEIQARELTGSYTRQQRVQDQINVLEPYITSLPFAMAQWLVFNQLWSTLGGLTSLLGALDSLFNNLGYVIGDLLPPFADMTNANTPAPSANIYIDLSPISSTYGVNKVVAPGIQAIELMVNCEKDGYGKQLKGINDSGSAATSSGVGSLKEAYVLSINPRNLMNGASETSLEGQGLLNLSESVVVSEVTTTSQSIVVTNPGTREAVLKSNADGTGDSGASGYLNSTLLSEANGFPSGTIVRIVNDNGVYAPNIGANGVESSTTVTDVRQRVDIVWDASSVDLVAATEATENSNGLRLAGYVYGYALNSVVAAIPVYLTSDYQVTDVQAYVDYNGDGTREKADIKLDVSSPNGSALPDIVYVTFENDTGYYFGTALKNADGETYQALREKNGGALTVNGVSYEAVSTTDAEGVTTITPTTYPAYATYLVKSTATDGTAIKVGDTYYKTVTYEGVTYLVIRNGITSGFPVGEFSWNDEDVSFGWEGGETTVNFSYSWGYATETSYAASVKVVANNVTAIELPESVNGILTLNESGNGITLNLDELLKDVKVEDYKSTIINTLKALENLTVTLGGETSAILYAGWDLTALESAIDALAVKDGEAVKSYNFYQGLRANVTLWLGGKPVEGGKVFYNNGGLFNGSGFVYNAENTVNYADEGYIAQAFTVTVTVDSNVVDNVVGGLVFNPYAEYAASMETSDFAGREVEIRFADGSNRVFTVSDSQSGGRNIRISYLCVISGDKEYVVWDGTGTKPESNVALADLMKEISFKGYTGKYGDIYLVGTIGTDIVGVQQVYLPVTVESLSPVYKEHGFVITSTAGTEIGVNTSYAVDKLGNFMFSTDGTAYKLAHGKQNFDWNFSTSLGTTETVSVNLLWNNAKFYTDSGFVNEVALGSLQEGSYYYAILPFSVNGAATGSGEYQTIKVQLYFADRDVEIEAGSTLPVTSGAFTGNVFRFTDKNNIPDMSLVEYITQEIGTSPAFDSQVGNVTVELASVNFGSFEGNKNRNLRDIASAGGYNGTVTYSFTATAENGLEYKFTGNVSIYVVSTKPVDPVVNPVLVTIDDVRLNQIVVDPLAYASFNAYVAAFKSAYAGKTFTTKNGNAIVNGTFDSLSFSDIGYAENGDNNSALPLAGGNYSGKRVDFTDANGVKYYGYVDVVVVNREVSSYEFVLNGFEATVTRGEMGAIRTTTYVNNTTGAVVRIVTNAAGLPTAINVLNPFAFDWETIFAAGNGLLVTLGDTGEQLLLSVDNPFATGDLAKAFDGFSLSAGYTNESLTLSFRNGDVAVPFNITVEFTVDPVKLTMYNTDLASDALAYNGLKYNASVYGYESLGGKVVPSVYDLLKGTEEFVWYVDGMFVKSSAKDTYVAMGYKVLAGEQGEYSYNYSRGMYTLEENGKYVFVYSAAVTMDAVWDHTQLSYSFAGGIRDTYAVVSANGTTVGNISATVTVPVNIYSSEISEVTFTANGYDAFGKNGEDYFLDEEQGKIYFGAAGSTNYFAYNEGKFYFDPLSGIDPFEQVTLTFPVVGEMTVYKWFPLSVSVTTKGGLTNSNLYVGWTLSDFVFNYEGGSFKISIDLKQTSMNGGTNVIPEQRFTPNVNNVVVKEREVSAVNTTEADYGALAALTGFAGNGTYIDPYNFDIAVFRRAVGDIGSLKFTLGGSEYVFSADSKEYNLSWDYSRFSVTYLGGAVYLTALLTGPDGSTQTYSFPFLVTRVLVNQIVATKGGTVDLGASVNFSINTDVTSANLGVATSNHNIDPFVPKSQSLPKGWTVNFTASNPVYANGVVTGWTSTSYASLSKDYIAVSMPKIDWTWDMVTGGKTIGYATMQIENGQRLKINVTVTARGTAAPATKPTAMTKGSLYSLQTSFTEGGKTYSVVWVGTASVVGSGNSYNVTFASAGSEYVIQRKGQRKVTYNLTAYVGAVIDANGNVLIYDESGNPAKLVAYDGYGFTV